MENQAAWKKWILSFGIFACVGSTIFASPIVQTLSEAYPDESMTTIRLITTIPSLMSFTLALAFASLVGKKIRYKTALVAGSLLSFVGGVLPAFWNQSFGQIIVARLIYGLGFSMFASRNAVVAQSFGQKDAALWMGRGTFLGNVISILGQLASGRLGDINWRYSFLLYFVCLGAMIVNLLLFREPEKAAEQSKSESAGQKEKLFTPIVVIFALLSVCSALCVYPYISSISNFVAARGLGSASQSSWASAAFSLGGAATALLFGRFYRALGRWTANVGYVIVILGYLCVLSANHIAMVVLGGVLCGAGNNLTVLFIPKRVLESVDPSRQALAVALMAGAISFGSFFSSYFMVAARRVGSFLPFLHNEVEAAFFAGICLFLLMFAALAVLNMRESKKSA